MPLAHCVALALLGFRNDRCKAVSLTSFQTGWKIGWAQSSKSREDEASGLWKNRKFSLLYPHHSLLGGEEDAQMMYTYMET